MSTGGGKGLWERPSPPPQHTGVDATRCGHEVAAQGQDQTLGRDAAAEFSAVSRLDGGRGIKGIGPKRAGAEAARHCDPCWPISLVVFF